jgi:hypothetical protein
LGTRARPAGSFLAILIVLVWSGVGAAELLNPSFETTYAGLPWPRLLPAGWYHADHPSFNSYCTDLWRTDGSLSAAMFSRIGKAVIPGNYQSFYVFADLTGIASIKFDVRLMACPTGAFEHFEASFLVDGAPLWSKNVGGVYLDQQVNVANLPGWHCVEIRNTALEAGTCNLAYWTLWDNLRAVEGPKAIRDDVEFDPPVLNPRSNGNYITCYIGLEEGYDVRLIDGSTVTLNGNIRAIVDGRQGWAVPGANADNVADFDSDGVLERMVKFERAAVVRAIVEAQGVPVTVEGRLKGPDGILFTGSAVLRVLDK